MDLDGHATTFRFLIRDRGRPVHHRLRAVLAGSGIDTVTFPPGCPQANCFAERFALTARTELADRILRTLLRWHAHLVTRRWSYPRRPGRRSRLTTDHGLVLRMA